MNKIELTYFPYSLNFAKPFSTSKGTIKKREGFIIQLKSSAGKTGTGDAAPFREFGSESFDEAGAYLKNFRLNFKIDLDNISQSIEDNLSGMASLPALRHGFEQALLNLICSEKNISLNELLNVRSTGIINVNTVIGFLPPKETALAAAGKVGEGFSTIKIKIGRDSFEEDYECLNLARRACGSKIKIRADANGKWSFDQAAENLIRLEKLNLEYVEQPVNTPEDFIKLSRVAKVPLAADESIRSFKDAEIFISTNAASVLVLKPMMLGGIIPVLRIIDLAVEKGMKVVITSSFESAIGKAMAVFAASAINDETAHGLDTGSYFENGLTGDPYEAAEGKIVLNRKLK